MKADTTGNLGVIMRHDAITHYSIMTSNRRYVPYLTSPNKL